MRIDHLANTVGRDQLGLALRAQLVDAGIHPRTIEARVRAGVWTARPGGVVDLGTHPPSWEQAVLAAVLGGPTGALASHRTAGRLHELFDVRAAAYVELTVPRPARNRRQDVKLRSSTAPDLGTVVGGIPATRWPRTIRDLAPVLHPTHLHRVVAEALRRRDEAAVLLADELHAAPRTTAGIGRFAAALAAELGSDRRLLDSPLEDVWHRALCRRDVPPETVQHVIRSGPRIVARADFAWPSVRHTIEVDGRPTHTADPDVARHVERDGELATIGWTVKRVTWEDLREPAQTRVVEELRERLAG